MNTSIAYVPFALAAMLVTAGCTSKNPAYCDESQPCDPNSGAPYCDLNGDFGPRNTCVEAPPFDAGTDAVDGTVPDAAEVALQVVLDGDGNGSVLSSPGGIDCGVDCTANFPAGTMVTLTATPGSDSKLVSWAGCDSSALECMVTVEEATTITARFELIEVVQVVAGGTHTCALLDTGAVRCWGYAGDGQLGYGNADNIGDNEQPLTAGDVDTGGLVTQLAAGGAHTCALLDTGAVRCWGNGFFGQLGYGNTSNIGDTEAPSIAGDVSVGGKVVQIAAGGSHTCALLETGGVRCWGRGDSGQLGFGNTDDIGDDETPASAGDVAVGGTVTQIAAGTSHTCALLDTGKVRCWGSGSLGRLGYGNTNNIGDTEAPSAAGDVGVGGTVVQVAAGAAHTCALLDDDAIRCWGANDAGELGLGTTETIGDNEAPFTAGVVDVGGPAMRISLGGDHSCALLDSGAIRCWGNGSLGQLGYGATDNIGDNESPASAGDVSLGGIANRIGLGAEHTCALIGINGIRCWGNGGFGQLGYANTDSIGDDELPATAGNVPLL